MKSVSMYVCGFHENVYEISKTILDTSNNNTPNINQASINIQQLGRKLCQNKIKFLVPNETACNIFNQLHVLQYPLAVKLNMLITYLINFASSSVNQFYDIV